MSNKNVSGKPGAVQWPQNEALIATLLAYELSNDDKYLDWHERLHQWVYAHFPDPEYGEWLGYLHRDGSVSSQLKGRTQAKR